MVFGKGGCVYIITNKEHSVLYTGVTSDLRARVWQHQNHQHPSSFSAKYNCNKLVYYYSYAHIEDAIAAEKSIKAGNRNRKITLVNSINPEWRDLSIELLSE
ncbi:GIY-YIG nuclease family protein [Mucilaginibacter terrenus]|uniref:GIY-YIG nuclease family protein n=1 Tax=Mucilaginibacter terrenus TaxID=2482727 RepID=A0A3E2NMV5_9SPHI|nr:GIY-YIG nuclease family protein [Mucilaginibacter terrenus]RFZ82301.1 GIY-YIG nuclease family protein [Mucilaginibacter terrenus]